MKILFIHPNIPGQYKHLCRAFAQDPANQVIFICKQRAVEVPGVRKIEYKLPRAPSPRAHRYLQGTEKAVLSGQEVWRVCRQLKQDEGFVPDIICAHPGWGDALYVKDIYPGTPLLSFFEFYYRSKGGDVGFDPEDPVTEDDKARVRTKNITNLLSLESADWGVSPTFWQQHLHPAEFRHKISVIHDGIDTDVVKPAPQVEMTLPGDVVVRTGDEVVTHIARNFEPYRGFPTFMKAAEIILKERPRCHIVAIGGDAVSYGRKPPAGKTYRQVYSEQVSLDWSRLHFVGTVPYDKMLKVLQISSAHIYLTYPFVLSWSMLEAMSAGCVLVGSRTTPVEEVITDGVNGLLADFFSPEEVAAQVMKALDAKDRLQDIRNAARRTVIDKYDLKTLLPLQRGLISDLAAGKNPPPTADKINALYE